MPDTNTAVDQQDLAKHIAPIKRIFYGSLAFLAVEIFLCQAFGTLQSALQPVLPFFNAIGDYIPALTNSLDGLSPERAALFRFVMPLNLLLGLLFFAYLVIYRFDDAQRKRHISLIEPDIGIPPKALSSNIWEKRAYWKKNKGKQFLIMLAFVALFWWYALFSSASPHPTGTRYRVLHDNHYDAFLITHGIFCFAAAFLLFVILVEMAARLAIGRQAKL